jgi:dihydroorotase-like cyclic amidohydrolase
MKFDLLIKDCLVVDPKNDLQNVASVGIQKKKIIEVAEDIDGRQARQVLHFPGKMLMPGLIDTHVHTLTRLGGALGFTMMTRAGVTTALDLGGPSTELIHAMKEQGTGMNIAVLDAIHPGQTVVNNDPSISELRDMVNRSLNSGALGIKLLGGHYPLTPNATRNAIKAANEQHAYVAFHAGSTKNGSNLNGMMEAIELCEGQPFHLAHINAYCRGLIKNPIEEVQQALQALNKNRHVISEFHLATVNGTSGKCINGVPESHVTRTTLKMGGYEPTEEGLKKAFLGGWGYCTAENIDGENILISSKAALDYWLKNQGQCTVGFPVNNRITAFLCATGRDKQNRFIIDALSTDGGSIPRNFLLKLGLQVVDWGAWTLTEFVSRTSLVPSRMLGLINKGHLTPGADADITIVDLKNREAVATIVNGELTCVNGVITGKRGTVLCTEHGKKKCQEMGIDYEVVDLDQSMLYKGRNT